MIRIEALAEIQSSLGRLPDDQVDALADMVRTLSRPTVFSTLSAQDRTDLDSALDSLDRGESFALDEIDASLETRLKAAGV